MAFADGAFTDETAASVSGSSKTDIAVDFDDPSSIAYSGSFTEAAANDGSVTGSVTATLTGDTFAAGVGHRRHDGGRGDGVQRAERPDRGADAHR